MPSAHADGSSARAHPHARGTAPHRIARSLKKTALAAGIATLQALLALGRALAHVGRGLVVTGIACARGIARAVIPCYRAWWTIRRVTARAQLRNTGRLVALVTSRTAAYGVFSIAILVIAAQTIHAREYGGFIGERPLLAAFVSTGEEEDVEEAVVGPAVPQGARVRAASVGGPLEPIVLGATTDAAQPAPSAVPIVGYALVQPTITDTAAAETGSIEIRSYTVTDGDTLSTIAEKFGIATSTILWENHRTVDAVLRPGDVLRILPVDGVTHTVRARETLEAIAKRYGVDPGDVLEVNNLVEADDLAAGDVLIIPGAHPLTVIAPPAPRPSPVFRPSVPLPSIAGKLFWPSAEGYRISQYFTWRHHGVDIAIAQGTPVFASEAGTVVYSGWMRGYGYQVTIDHGNGLKTRYGHNSKLLVTIGEQVSRGQLIALVGSTGHSTGPHIHFETIVNGTRVNPLQFLR